MCVPVRPTLVPGQCPEMSHHVPDVPFNLGERKVGAEDRATTEFRCGLFLGRDFTLTLGKAILVIGGRLPVDDLAGDDHGGGQSPETDSIVCILCAFLR